MPPKSSEPKKQRKRGYWIKFNEEIEGKVYERKVYIKASKSTYQKMMPKLNKKIYTKPSGVGLAKPLNGIKSKNM
jgi:hypothetical protein